MHLDQIPPSMIASEQYGSHTHTLSLTGTRTCENGRRKRRCVGNSVMYVPSKKASRYLSRPPLTAASTTPDSCMVSGPMSTVFESSGSAAIALISSVSSRFLDAMLPHALAIGDRMISRRSTT
jgi:hypothetical protein